MMASNGGLDSWNPMQYDHNDQEFNVYDRGPGKDMPKRGPDRYGGVSLYVTGIPMEMTEEGLVNLFSKAGRCVEAKKMKSKVEGTGDTYGFIKMATVNECEKAIQRYNDFSIGDFKLRVKFSRTEEERNRQGRGKLEEEELVYSQNSRRNSRPHSKASSGSESDGNSNCYSKSGEKIMFGKKSKTVNSPPTLQEAPVKIPVSGDGRTGILGEYPGTLSPVSPSSRRGTGPASQVSPSYCRGAAPTHVDPSLFHSPGGSNLSLRLQQSQGRGQPVSPNQNGSAYHGNRNQDFYEQSGYASDPNYGMQNRSEGEYRHMQGVGRGDFRGSMRGYFRGRGNMGYSRGRGNFGPYFNDNYGNYGGRGGGMGYRGRGMNTWGYNNNYYQGGYRGPETWQNNGPNYSPRGGRGRSPQRGRGGQMVSRPDRRPLPDRPCAKCGTVGSFQCSRCKTPYCSEQCQIDHWADHRQSCVNIARGLEEDKFASRFEITIGDDAVAEEMKSYAKTLLQEDRESQNKSQASPQAKPPNAPQQQGRSQSSPGQSRTTNGHPPQSAQRPTNGHPPQSAQRSGMSPAAKTSSVPSPKVKSTPPEHQKSKIELSALEVGQENEMIVLDVEDPNRIILQFYNAQNLQTLAANDAEMKTVLDVDNHSVPDPAVGEFYAGQFTDGSWYRCRVDALQPGQQVSVTYIDYGNTETISYSKLRNLQSQWCALPGQAMVCSLDGVIPHMDCKFWSQQAVDKIKELLPLTMNSGRLSKVTCVSKDESVTHVKVLDANGLDVGEILIDSGLAAKENLREGGPQFISIDAKDIEEQTVKWEVGQQYPVLITERDTPLSFYVQRVADIQTCGEFCKNVNEECLGIAAESYRPDKVGEVVYGLYDGNWFRAEVLSLSDQQAKIYFMDYGNTELVPFKDLRQATSLCRSEPSFCVHCELVGVDPTGAKATTELFNELTHEKSPKMLAMIYKGKKQGKAIVDFLEDEGETVSVVISRFLSPVMAEDVLPTTLPTNGAPVTGTIMIIHSLASFYVQIDSNVQQIMREVAEICSKDSVPYSPRVGEMVFGQYMEDQHWYRAKVLEESDGEVRLLYTDFGNQDTVMKSSVRKFHPSLSRYPHQSIHCKLASIQESMKTPEVLHTFGRFCDKEVKVKLKGPSQADPLEVDILLEDGSNINETIVQLFSNPEVSGPQITPSTELSFQKPPIPFDGSRVECTLSGFQNFDSFYLQLNATQELENLMSQLESLNDDPTPHHPRVGENVCALYSEDRKWYRARVTEKCEGDSYSVFFIDYGNTSQVTANEIRKLKRAEYVQLPCLALHSRLDVPRPLSDDLKAKFGELAFGGATCISFQAVSEQDGLYNMRLFAGDGTCINDVLVGLLPGPAVAEAVSCDVITNGVQDNRAAESDANTRPKIPDLDFPINGEKLPFLVTDIKSVDSFYAHYYTDESHQKFSNLLEKMNAYCSGISDPYNPVLGEEVCCKLASEQWSRAQVVAVNDSLFEVLFVDYGSTQTVQASEIRKADVSFLYLPKQAIHCKLQSGICRSSSEVLEVFDAAVSNKLSYLQILKKEGEIYQVHISTDEEDVSEILQKKRDSFVARVLPVSSARELCKFVDLDSLKSFYVQLVGPPHEGILSALEKNIACFCEKSSSSYQPRKDDIVLTKFTDGMWYRAKILEVMEGSMCKVWFIDYGNVDFAAPTDIKQIDPSLLSVSNFAIHCKLSGMESNELHQLALTQFAKLTIDPFQLEVVRVEDDLHEVILFTAEGENINECVLQAVAQSDLSAEPPSLSQVSPVVCKAQDSPKPEAVSSRNLRLSDMTKVEPKSEEFHVVITSIDSPMEFFCQLADKEAVQKLAVIMDTMMSYCETQPFDPNHKYIVGDVCCAFYSLNTSADGGWYRSVITETFPDDTYSLQYIDFGNRAIVPSRQIRPMKPDFMELPILVFKCSLHGILPVGGSWSTAANETLGQFLDCLLLARLKDQCGDVFALQLTQLRQDESGVSEIGVVDHMVAAGVALAPPKAVDEAVAIQQEIAALQAKLMEINKHK